MSGYARIAALFTAVALTVAACSSADDAASSTSSPGTSSPVTTSPVTTSPVTTSPATTSPVTTGQDSTTVPADNGASPLVIAAIDFAAGFVLIRNDGADDYDLSGHWVCNRPTYAQLPAMTLAPGAIVEIEASSLGLSADTGEVALFTSHDFSDPGVIVRYVQWGSDSHGRTSVAVAGGVWVDGDFVDNGGGNLQSEGADPVAATDWVVN